MPGNILSDLIKGLEESEIPYVVKENVDSGFEVRFPDANDSDCLLLVLFKNNSLEIHRVMGAGVVKRVFDSAELTEDFFYLLKRDHAMVRRSIELRDLSG